MAQARTWSVGLVGVTGALVEVAVDDAPGAPGLSLVGLPDAVVRQSVDRVRAAVRRCGWAFPDGRVTIALSPAAMPKQGAGFDLALAVAALAATGKLALHDVDRPVFLGEVGLDGSLRGVRGVLPGVLAARDAGFGTVVLPAAVADEAALVGGVQVLAAGHLREVVDHLRRRGPRLAPHQRTPAPPLPPGPDLADVVGQVTGRRAVEVAAAGGHHLLLSGPPGAGKTMLAQRLPGLLPALDDELATEVTAVASVAGTLPPGAALITRPPFEAPHHSASAVSLVGGGSGQIRPGALSRAHGGVLFLDGTPARYAAAPVRRRAETGPSGSVRSPHDHTGGSTMRRAALLLPALLLLAACGGTEDPAPAAETTSSAAASTSASDPLADAAADDVDVTTQLQDAAGGAAWAGVVTTALQTEPGRLEVTTSIVDPRGDNGSPEAQQATEVCEGAVAYLQAQGAPATNVRVNEADGTAFIIYGPPAGDACTEY